MENGLNVGKEEKIEVKEEKVQNETNEPRPRLIILANNIGRTLK